MAGKRSFTLGVLHQGGRWSKMERGDIANKGDIVCDAYDSQEAEDPLSVGDTGSLKPSPVLFSWPLPSHLCLFFRVNRHRIQFFLFPTQVSVDGSEYPSQSLPLLFFSFPKAKSNLLSELLSIYTWRMEDTVFYICTFFYSQVFSVIKWTTVHLPQYVV